MVRCKIRKFPWRTADPDFWFYYSDDYSGITNFITNYRGHTTRGKFRQPQEHDFKITVVRWVNYGLRVPATHTKQVN